MKRRPSISYWLILLLSLLIAAGYGYSFLAVITNRQGLHGDMYMYYQLSKEVYLLYEGSIAAAAAMIAFALLFAMLNRRSQLQKLASWSFLILLLAMIGIEWYLSTRFAGKA